VIEGGVSVNSIAPEASCLVDLRSIDESALHRLGEQVDRVVAAQRPGLTITADLIGDRPAGIVPLDSPIVRLASGILSALGVDVAYDASSTDANVPIARGIPAVCVGLTTGGNVHRPDEYIDLPPIPTGLAQLALLALGLADAVAARSLQPTGSQP
jgi:acetylornithine deacetylase/succinyl-diaminopimelate desuccinylase-like protein